MILFPTPHHRQPKVSPVFHKKNKVRSSCTSSHLILFVHRCKYPSTSSCLCRWRRLSTTTTCTASISTWDTAETELPCNRCHNLCKFLVNEKPYQIYLPYALTVLLFIGIWVDLHQSDIGLKICQQLRLFLSCRNPSWKASKMERQYQLFPLLRHDASTHRSLSKKTVLQ